MRVNFSQLFRIQDGAITPNVPIHINGITMGPGVLFGSGVNFGGIDFTQHVGKDFEVEKENEVYIIKGIYN